MICCLIQPRSTGVFYGLYLSKYIFTLKNSITHFIDLFYPPFKRFFPLQTFRYAVCGGSNMLLDIFIYYISYHYILHKNDWHVGAFVFKPHIGALIIAFCVSFPVGFLLSKYVVFGQSYLRGNIQLIRYMLVVAVNLLLNYILLKIMVEYWHFFPTIARIFITALIVSFSYLSQKHFTFKSIKGSPSN